METARPWRDRWCHRHGPQGCRPMRRPRFFMPVCGRHSRRSDYGWEGTFPAGQPTFPTRDGGSRRLGHHGATTPISFSPATAVVRWCPTGWRSLMPGGGDRPRSSMRLPRVRSTPSFRPSDSWKGWHDIRRLMPYLPSRNVTTTTRTVPDGLASDTPKTSPTNNWCDVSRNVAGSFRFFDGLGLCSRWVR